jgi:hypothetical protein
MVLLAVVVFVGCGDVVCASLLPWNFTCLGNHECYSRNDYFSPFACFWFLDI